jgi:hypothetical protein
MEHITQKDFIKELTNGWGFTKKQAKEIANKLDFSTEYECFADYQYGDFGVGRIQTEPEWLITAFEWKDNGCFYEEEDFNFWLELSTSHSLIEWIADNWEIGIQKI